MSDKIIFFPVVKQKSVVKSFKVSATVRALAVALRVNLNITADASLVYIIGNGEAKTNQDAIECWLMDNYSEEDIKSIPSPLDEITNTLKRYLNNKLMMEDGSC